MVFGCKNNRKLKLKDFKDGTYEVKIVNIEKTVFKGTTFFGCSKIFTTRFQKHTKHEALTMNKNSIIGFISSVISGMYKSGVKSRKIITTKNHGVKAQLSLLDMINGGKTGEI